jgi:hypothetical protein
VPCCKHSAEADLHKLIEEGRGDVPLVRLHYRCSNCRGAMTDFVGKAKPDFLRPP